MTSARLEHCQDQLMEMESEKEDFENHARASAELACSILESALQCDDNDFAITEIKSLLKSAKLKPSQVYTKEELA
jgi:hypothetical protein